MDSQRTPSERIRECLRLASYQIDGVRLYTNDEIADQLGETSAWVAGVLYTNSEYQTPAKIVHPRNCRTNMTYDPGKPADGSGDETPPR